MPTLVQTTTMRLKVIEHQQDGRPTLRIIDAEEGTLIAKVNGPQNLPVAEQMAEAYNNLPRYQEMERTLHLRLCALGLSLKGADAFSRGIRSHLQAGGSTDEMLKQLKETVLAQPGRMEQLLGNEMVSLIKIL